MWTAVFHNIYIHTIAESWHSDVFLMNFYSHMKNTKFLGTPVHFVSVKRTIYRIYRSKLKHRQMRQYDNIFIDIVVMNNYV